MSESNGTIPSSDPPSVGGITVEQPGYTLTLTIPDNYLECHCSYVPHEQGTMLTPDELAETLKKYDVLEMIDQTACEEFVIMAAAGRQLSDVLLACGTPPMAGTDGYLLVTAPTSTMVHSNVDEEATIDMYRVLVFINVVTGVEIGRIMPAVPGVAGRNVKGEPLEPEPVKALKYTLGKNIALDEESGILSATAAGRFCQLGGEFSVEDQFVVKGDVDFNIGTLDFKGFVEVHGDVLDHFNITATKGLMVTGNIGVCAIVSDGDISLCGMDGQDHGSIVCGRTLHAHHLHNTAIECGGDVVVDVEIHDCIVKTLGRIFVNKDTISGGTCIAMGGIEAGKLGSPSARHTHLFVGADYHDVEVLIRLHEELTATQSKIEEVDSLEEITALHKKTAALSERMAHLRSKTLPPTANAKINVKKTLHENVHMVFGDVTEMVQEERDGPLTIVANVSEGGVRYIPMSGLNVKASDVELAYLLEQKLKKGS